MKLKMKAIRVISFHPNQRLTFLCSDKIIFETEKRTYIKRSRGIFAVLNKNIGGPIHLFTALHPNPQVGNQFDTSEVYPYHIKRL